jgi:hypothetical protein
MRHIKSGGLTATAIDNVPGDSPAGWTGGEEADSVSNGISISLYVSKKLSLEAFQRETFR